MNNAMSCVSMCWIVKYCHGFENWGHNRICVQWGRLAWTHSKW